MTLEFDEIIRAIKALEKELGVEDGKGIDESWGMDEKLTFELAQLVGSSGDHNSRVLAILLREFIERKINTMKTQKNSG